ncbi:MAG: hypothetical protein F6K58_11805 [Symploca sp. SIO2E9]|nr:hypothetical protein [Symploca sp. SIO2E9]
MSGNKTPTKEQIIKAIKQLENNPHDKVKILSDVGIGVVGAAGAGAAAFAFGGGAVSILFGLVALPYTAPIGLVLGAAALGGAALLGAKKVFFEGTYDEGKKAEMLRQLEEQKKEIEAKERTSKLGDSDKTKLIIFLKEPVGLDLISPKDAQDLISAVESGRMELKEAYKLVEDVIKSAKTAG